MRNQHSQHAFPQAYMYAEMLKVTEMSVPTLLSTIARRLSKELKTVKAIAGKRIQSLKV